jgi:hypothetical protein
MGGSAGSGDRPLLPRVETIPLKSRVLTVAAVAAAAAVLAACETTPIKRPVGPPPPPPPPPTPAEEFAWSTLRGANDLTVVIAYHPAAGQEWTCSGLTEALMPETSYSRGRIVKLYGSSERALHTTAEVRERSAANPGADYGQYVKTAVCNGRDSFTLPDLPDGAYFIIARVKPVRPAGASEMVIMQRVELAGGKAVRITLPEAGARAPAPGRGRRPQ